MKLQGIGRGLCEVLLQRNAKVFISTLDSRECNMREYRKFHEFVEPKLTVVGRRIVA